MEGGTRGLLVNTNDGSSKLAALLTRNKKIHRHVNYHSSRFSPLVANLSHFLASRNHHVIKFHQRHKHHHEAASCYRKLRANADGSNNEQVEQPLTVASPSYSQSLALSFVMDEQQQCNQRPLIVKQQSKKLHHRSSASSASKTLHLLRDFASPGQKNRTLLLRRLLRAPVVLAALFSLALSASLLVLYTMNFHAHSSTIESNNININNNNNNLLAQFRSDRASREVSAAELVDRKPPSLSVKTECGFLTGTPDGPAVQFKGIPYASVARRWARPLPLWLNPQLCSPGARLKTNENSDHCAQISPVKRRFSGHEDCLYLDIYSAQLNQAKKLPVMFYIHGGFLTFGSSGAGQVNWMKARPSGQLASELNVILVSFNYRLQSLGFMSLPDDTDGATESSLRRKSRHNGSSVPDETEKEEEWQEGGGSNYGLWDQLAALNWVRRNIDSFGGDPENIVLFGPDSASALPIALLSGKHRTLFRAAWLTNPTLYYELPSELASQHYRRLFLYPSTIQNYSCPATTFHREEVPKKKQNSSEIIECLRNLSAEQIVRLYLSQDDPSYRLDDQNSLPIHGIFADQFVTVDGHLVQDSYPFGASTTSKASREVAEDLLVNAASKSRNCSDDLQLNHQLERENTITNEKQQTIGDYDDCSSRGDAKKENNNNNNNNKRRVVVNANKAVDLLIGSSSQAVEYWPCPRNLNQWKWDDFKRYVATSLNSFASDTYERACEVYQVPANESSTGASNPKETYLTMVSDIRQICPINELADSLHAKGHSIHRYIIETSYSGTHSSSSSNSSTSSSFNALWPPEFSFHTWDLIAFFGFHFDTQFQASEQDLKFQAQIRAMVKDFVHKNNTTTSSYSDAASYTLFSKSANTKQVKGKHKASLCKMWRSHLGRSYAWVS